ncbi:putative membrane protein SpoIIM required for sporulation [Roseimicrobium gellanilyticum]|uniref:Putative membrane protein SpoIIM required for sporulation n=1 Tax=Roseimicrobium gellanilyticum TaxID=748857 RepID=A0A366HIK8_9BACT|nr:stage II sporulation protein M [Roseimicrobium gellanilyticum]RBP42598.1 putative membrane protein SpoIIM required for sporulation [Roseimicrobium gellanilyticum]
MIADLKTFIERERPHWKELERELEKIREHLADLSDLKYARHVLGLYQRTSSDLARLQGSSSEPELRAYLENLVGSGYAEIHSATRDRRHFRPWQWLVQTFPQAFRRQIWGFWMSVALTLVGALLGAFLISKGVEGREAIYPFPHLVHQTPSERVAREEQRGTEAVSKGRDDLEGRKATFSAELMRNNISVTFRAMAFGMTWGIGTLLILFYNGVVLGAVVFDYVSDGQTVFMLGWLLPHGSVEIPAILLGGQAGLILGRALIGWGTPDSLRTRFRKITPDLATIAGGAALLLVWAGIIEAFFSQYHEPVLPYWVKILFGAVQLVALAWFLFFCGKPKAGADELQR